jgi:hypothetical protein
MQDKVILYGDYIEPKCPAEHSILQFKASTLNIDQLWENGCQSAAFLSGFWSKFFSSYKKQVIADIENSIRYISAELIGNAIKYGYPSDLAINIVLSVPDSEIHFFVKNKVTKTDAIEYQNLIKILLSNDPEKMYIDQMEKNAIDSSSKSCIGFLTIALDYGGNLGWKFEVGKDSEAMTATTTVRLPVVENLLSSPTIV